MVLKKFIRQRIKGKNFRKKWHKLNSNNQTTPIGIFDTSKVSIGIGTYGPINILSWNSENEKLQIGKYCSIAKGVKFLLGGNHYFNHLSNYPFSNLYKGRIEPAVTNGPIILEDGVWIGLDSLILSGVTIGKGAIIGAGTIVSKNIPPFAIVAGNPGRIIKYRFDEEIIKRLVKIDYYKIMNHEFYEKYQDLIDNPLVEELIKVLEEYE